jgi:KaiC/GvpD/RAD55 family RecA-like ATPase
VTLYWGSANRPSKVTIPFTNHASVAGVKITDYRGAENQTFNVQAPPNQNIVFLTANVRDIFGLGPGGDVTFVNLTISGPQGPIRDRTNITMVPSCTLLQCPQPAQYQAYWVYPASTPEATYSVAIDIADSQGNVIHDTSGVHSFGIGHLPPPFPLLAALISGGGLGVAGLATGAVYLRRRRTKEYLAPFSFFEQMTGGEVPGGSMVTVEGNTGAGKTTLCSEVMYEDLKRGRPCIYVAADDFPDRIRDQMRNLGIDVGGYEKSGILSFVDCYSAEAGRIPTEKFSVSSVGDLTTLGVKISSALQDQKGTCLYLDSLSPFVPRAKPESIVSFVHAIGAKVRGLDGKAFFTMSTGSDETIQRQMEDMADCVIQMEAFEEKDVRRRRLRIRKFRNRRHQEGWATFTIEDGKGIIFYTKHSRRSS